MQICLLNYYSIYKAPTNSRPTFCSMQERLQASFLTCFFTNSAQKVLSEQVLRVSEDQASLSNRRISDDNDFHQSIECLCHTCYSPLHGYGVHYLDITKFISCPTSGYLQLTLRCSLERYNLCPVFTSKED